MNQPSDSETGSVSGEQSQNGNQNVKKILTQVDEVVGIMKSNVDKILIRDERLTELNQRADQLNASASEFKTTARKIKKEYWWQNIKIVLILVSIVLLIIIIITISVIEIPSPKSNVPPPAVTAAP